MNRASIVTNEYGIVTNSQGKTTNVNIDPKIVLLLSAVTRALRDNDSPVYIDALYAECVKES